MINRELLARGIKLPTHSQLDTLIALTRRHAYGLMYTFQPADLAQLHRMVPKGLVRIEQDDWVPTDEGVEIALDYGA